MALSETANADINAVALMAVSKPKYDLNSGKYFLQICSLYITGAKNVCPKHIFSCCNAGKLSNKYW
jgi:hypothetical protein